MNIGWLRHHKVLALVLAGVLVALLVSLLPTKEWSAEVQTWLKSLGFWEFPAFIVIYVLTTTLGLPNIVLILVAGTLFGFPQGFVSVSIADTLGAATCYGFGRTLARKHVKKLLQRYPTFAQLDRAIAQKAWKILLFSRLSPVIPSNVLNYGFSCTRVNFWQYLFFTWLGMLPVIGLYVYIGYFGVNMMGGNNKPGTLALQTIGLVVTIIAAVYTTRLAKSVLADSDASSEEAETE